MNRETGGIIPLCDTLSALARSREPFASARQTPGITYLAKEKLSKQDRFH